MNERVNECLSESMSERVDGCRRVSEQVSGWVTD